MAYCDERRAPSCLSATAATIIDGCAGHRLQHGLMGHQNCTSSARELHPNVLLCGARGMPARVAEKSRVARSVRRSVALFVLRAVGNMWWMCSRTITQSCATTRAVYFEAKARVDIACPGATGCGPLSSRARPKSFSARHVGPSHAANCACGFRGLVNSSNLDTARANVSRKGSSRIVRANDSVHSESHRSTRGSTKP